MPSAAVPSSAALPSLVRPPSAAPMTSTHFCDAKGTDHISVTPATYFKTVLNFLFTYLTAGENFLLEIQVNLFVKLWKIE